MADTTPPGRRAFTVAVRLTVAVLAGIVAFTAVTGLVDRMAGGLGAAVWAALPASAAPTPCGKN